MRKLLDCLPHATAVIFRAGLQHAVARLVEETPAADDLGHTSQHSRKRRRRGQVGYRLLCALPPARKRCKAFCAYP